MTTPVISPYPRTLRFGISSLDGLLGRPADSTLVDELGIFLEGTASQQSTNQEGDWLYGRELFLAAVEDSVEAVLMAGPDDTIVLHLTALLKEVRQAEPENPEALDRVQRRWLVTVQNLFTLLTPIPNAPLTKALIKLQTKLEMASVAEFQKQEQTAHGSKGMTVSVCIAGPSGVGKSILALHLAARYAADTFQTDTTGVFYASTDLSHAQARHTWDAFHLFQPKCVYEPFKGVDDPIEEPTIWQTADFPQCVTLPELRLDKVPDYLLIPQRQSRRQVGFINMQAETAGDDWQFLNNLLSLLPEPQAGEPRHLLVIDAIEGLETLAGVKDAFGMERSRRSRITQLIRTAKDKCHLVLIVEGGETREHPEKFVTDFVLRLRTTPDTTQQYPQYPRPSLEIEKARGQAHAAGQHLLLIRPPGGSTTGTQDNADEPAREYAYVSVIPSLHYLADRMQWQRGKNLPEPDGNRIAAFGIRYLDDMLRLRKASAEDEAAKDDDERGLPCGSVTALTGDNGTQKSRLTRAFAGRHFAVYARTAAEYLRTTIDAAVTKGEDVTTILPEAVDGAIALMEKQANDDPRATVFITTLDLDRNILVSTFLRQITRNRRRWEGLGFPIPPEHQNRLNEALRKIMLPRIFCRHLEKHSLNAPTLFHVIRQSVRAAQNQVLETCIEDPEKRKEAMAQYEEGWRIRVVLEDWQVIQDTYSDVRHDDTFLGMTLFYLCRQGVTTLVSHTRSGQPDVAAAPEENRLENEAHHILRTWRIRFSGNLDRVAIAAIPPVATDRPTLIRELRWESERIDETLTVDPNFELYQGLREGRPRLTPLRIRLYAESPAFVTYSRRMERLLREKFPGAEKTDILVQCSDTDDPDGSGASYENLRDLCHLQDDVPLDHALVFMVDEFWMVADKEQSSRLGSVGAYLSQATWEAVWGTDRAADTDSLFQPDGRTTLDDVNSANGRFRRADFFADMGQGLKQSERTVYLEEADRVPFTQNFGHLLCRKKAWEEAGGEVLTFMYDGQPIKVSAVWNEMIRVSTPGEVRTEDPFLSWRVFLEACSVAAKNWSVREGITRTLDLSRHSAESLPCLALEIWASEICTQLAAETTTDKLTKLTEKLSRHQWRQSPKEDENFVLWLTGAVPWSEGAIDKSIKDGTCPGFTLALYKTLLLLSEVLTAEVLKEGDNPFRATPQTPQAAPVRAVASRVWYTTAAADQEGFDPHDPVIPLALPGRFTVRGDWFLALSPGGSSPRLAQRAMDIFNSETGNVARLEAGVGLPVRRHNDRRYDAVHTSLMGLRLPVQESPHDCVPLRYQDITALAPSAKETGFHPLWRSRLCDYDRHARIWQKWLLRELNYFIWLRHERSGEWTNGFTAYDKLPYGGIVPSNVRTTWETWKRFGRRCDDLARDLQGASPYREGSR